MPNKYPIHMGNDARGSIIQYHVVNSRAEVYTRGNRYRLWTQYGKIHTTVYTVEGKAKSKTVRVWRIVAVVRVSQGKYRKIRTQWTPLVSALDELIALHTMGINAY